MYYLYIICYNNNNLFENDAESDFALIEEVKTSYITFKPSWC